MTRTDHRWADVPGNFDKLNTNMLFYSDNSYGIPRIAKDLYVPEWLTPFKKRIRTDRELKNGAIHFFLDDYRFQHIWTRPFDTLSIIENIGAAFSPDFSTYTEYPIAVQLWNIYRNRWVGAFWQSMNIKVIPTISWSDERSYAFCFLGVEEGSNVAISTVGVLGDKRASDLFKNGYVEMIRQIKPSLVLCYGENAPFDLEEYNKVKWYPSYWKSIRDAMREDV